MIGVTTSSTAMAGGLVGAQARCFGHPETSSSMSETTWPTKGCILRDIAVELSRGITGKIL